jgi:hypothetical protein
VLREATRDSAERRRALCTPRLLAALRRVLLTSGGGAGRAPGDLRARRRGYRARQPLPRAHPPRSPTRCASSARARAGARRGAPLERLVGPAEGAGARGRPTVRARAQQGEPRRHRRAWFSASAPRPRPTTSPSPPSRCSAAVKALVDVLRSGFPGKPKALHGNAARRRRQGRAAVGRGLRGGRHASGGVVADMPAADEQEEDANLISSDNL